MSSASEEPPGEIEGEASESMVHAKEKCEQNKSQLESLKEIMLKNKQSLMKKEEEVQEYARRLSKIKSRAKLSRRSKGGSSATKDATHLIETDVPGTSEELNIDDISQAKTPKAKSTLLQKKLAENRKAFEQRNKEIIETKRAVEEKVEAIRQQLEEKDVAAIGFQRDQLSVLPIKPVMITSDVMAPVQIESIQEKDNKIAELTNKMLELEATIVDLQENLKEKDSVIESKTKAVTLMSADLSRKGKTTLDTLEDTKDEMRTMQEHFILLEESLKNKNENLLMQLQERDKKIVELEDSVDRFEKQIDQQKLSESASADFSRSTMDALVETKEAMKSMQENFVLMESSLKTKNENLLQQLNDYERKLAEANERVFQLESGIGIVKDPSVDDLRYKLEKLETSNKQLQDEKYELQKSVADLQDKVVNISSMHGNGAIIEKDNRILELENLIEELKQSNKLLEEESKAELQKQVTDLTSKNEEYLNKVIDLESLVHRLEEEKNEIAAKLPEEGGVKEEDEKVARLTKELEDLNKSMIKIKAQHKSKVKSLQKQLENFKKVSDTNAELVRLGNQVALLEEEKGNLQLSLVDFDELKASAGDWQERVIDLESKVSAQTKEIEMQIDAIATLENQKLDLMQELHTAKQEISSLEAENAESENLRVTAEMKVVDLEEQLEVLHKSQPEIKTESSTDPSANHSELLKQIQALTQENTELYNRISKLEEKGTSDTGSTESFEAIQELDKTDLLKKIEDLTQKNNELTLKLNKYVEKENTMAGGSIESMNDVNRNELLKKIDQLTQENADLTMKLNRIEEKGSSDTGSTESFERIPEHNESVTKIELLTQENNELMLKVAKLEEELKQMDKSDDQDEKRLKSQIDTLLEENDNQSSELSKLRIELTNLIEENNKLKIGISDTTEDAETSKDEIDFKTELTNLIEENKKLKQQIEMLSADKTDLAAVERKSEISETSKEEIDFKVQIELLLEEKGLLQKEVKELRNSLQQGHEMDQNVQLDEVRIQLEELLKAKEELVMKLSEFEILNKKLENDLLEAMQEKEELHLKLDQLLVDDQNKEEMKLIEKLEKLYKEKEIITREKRELDASSQKSEQQTHETLQSDESSMLQTELMIVASLEREIESHKKLIAEQTSLIEEMKLKLSNKEEELEEKSKQIQHETSEKKIESLENELKEMFNTIEEWKFKCNEMQEKIEKLEAGKTSIEEGFRLLQNENEILLQEKKEKDTEASLLKQELQETTKTFESKLQTHLVVVSEKESEISSLKEELEEKNRDLQNKFAELQNKMIAIDTLQDELNDYKILIQERDSSLTSMSNEMADLNHLVKSKEEEIHSLRRDITDLSDKVEESKPLKDYNDLLEQLKNKDMILDEMECKISATTKENTNLIEKIKNLSQQNSEIKDQLVEKQQELVDLIKTKDNLEGQIVEYKNDKSEAEKRVWDLQTTIETNAKYVDDLQIELKDSYRQMELLKTKQIEDVQLQNEKLENLTEELNAKMQECEVLKGELEEKEKLINNNLTEEVRIALEGKIADLEQKLKDAEDKIQAQLERMKKLTANLKKKAAMCQELESRVAELEEKWTTEKDEKEAKNKQIQEVEILMREKDNRIADLEEKLIKSRNDSIEVSKTIDRLSNDLTNSKEIISVFTQQITEMEEQIVQLRTNLEISTAALNSEKESKNNIISKFEAYRQEVAEENVKKQAELEEVTEKARELSVRMQVMETEYLQQLTLINNLKAENGLLLSKQAQINEKLETVEKESEERRLLLERMDRASTEATQTLEEVTDEMKTQRCSHCEQCQTLVQALEAKLQEREAEIENLDNELANSIGNFVQMRESLRFNDLMNQTGRNRSLEDPYNDLLFQYNSLISSHEEVKSKLEDALKENKELIAKVEELQLANATLEEKVTTTEQSLEENEQNAERLQSVSSSDLITTCQKREAELLNMRQAMEELQKEQLNSIQCIESQKENIEKLLEHKRGLEEEISSLRNDKIACDRIIEDLTMELEAYKNQSTKSEAREEIQLSVAREETQLSSFKSIESQKDVEKLLEENRGLEEEISFLRNDKLACERRIEDLAMELEVYKNESLKREAGEELQEKQLSSIKSTESQKEDIENLLQDTKRSLEQEISTLRSDKLAYERRIEDLLMQLEIYQNQSTRRERKEAPAFDATPQDNIPQLFDASKIFGLPSSSDSDLLANKEVKRMQALLDEKEAQCSNLTQEINHLQKLMIEERTQMSQNYSQCLEELEMSQKKLHVAQTNLEELEQVRMQEDSHIDWLNTELLNLSLQIMEQQNNMRKDIQIEELNMTLNSIKESLRKISLERDQQIAIVESYKSQIDHLKGELQNVTDPGATQELKNQIVVLMKTVDLLQLQVNDLPRSLEGHEDSTSRISRERDETKERIANLTQTLEDVYKESQKTVSTTDTSKDSVPPQETQQQTTEAMKVQEETLGDVASAWAADSTEKLNIDEDTWGWNAEDVLPTGEEQLALFPNTEIQLRATIDDLQDQIKDLEKDRERMIEESKSAQLRNAKMIKKLKEYKVQVENLQQQLKIQKSSDFYELDSAIEEELKSQISKLEKALTEAGEEQKSIISEKEALVKRLDVVLAANERYMEMKERQDMEMEVLRIRSKELTDKVETLEKRLSESQKDSEENAGKEDSKATTFVQQDSKVTMSVQQHPRAKRFASDEDYESLCQKYKEEIDDLKDEMEALATENEQLQRFLEEQKMKLSNLTSKQSAEEAESIQIVEDLNKRISELQSLLSKSKEEYDLLRKQYEQSLMDANDQVTIMRQNTDFLKEATFEKTSKLEAEITDLRQQLQISESNFLGSQKNLEDSLKEKENLEERLTTSTASYEKQLSSLNASMAEITDLLNIRIQEVADLKQELQRQYVVNVDYEDTKVKLEEVVEGLNRELSEKKKQIETLNETLNRSTQELVEKYTIEMEEKEKEIRNLQEKLFKLEASLNETLNAKETEFLQSQNVEKEKELQSLQEKLITLQSTLNDYSLGQQNNLMQIEAQRQELEYLKQNLIEKESILESLQTDLISTREELNSRESELSKTKEDNHRYLQSIEEIQKRLNEAEAKSIDSNQSFSEEVQSLEQENQSLTQEIQSLKQEIQSLKQEIQSLRSIVMEKDSTLQRYSEESAQYKIITNNNEMEIQRLETELLKKSEEINTLTFELEETRKILEETKCTLKEKVSLLENANQALNEKQTELAQTSSVSQQSSAQDQSSSNIIDGLPLFRMTDNSHSLQQTIDTMQAELEKRQEEIEHLKYILNENTYPSMIQKMQERINCLYNEKSELESSLELANLRNDEKEQEINDLKHQMQSHELVLKEEEGGRNTSSREDPTFRRSIQDQEQIVRLQNDLYTKEQEISELKYIISEKDSHLSLLSSMEPQSDDFELRETLQRLTADLYDKEQEIQQLKSSISKLEAETFRLQQFERLSEETRNALEKLNIEKEEVRLQAEEFLQNKLKEKELEIDEIKQKLSEENRSILDQLQLRDRDIENLKKQLEEFVAINQSTKNELHQRNEELNRVESELIEKERILNEWSITKDVELKNLQIQIQEKEARIEELSMLSNQEEKQLAELKNTLEARETEINSLKSLLEEKVSEYQLIQSVLKKEVADPSMAQSAEASSDESKSSNSQELDLALYMLHQRDVRCEELTHELMQLLEERDTLQLRLSNAIRVNEELRKAGGSSDSPKKEATMSSDGGEPVVEQPSPSKSEGPVEIAKEAINDPIGEDKERLALKLSQLHTMSHAKDVRLRDERELRHTQQMSLLAHKDVLSTLPPEAAARLVNANYTLCMYSQNELHVLNPFGLPRSILY
ncbi:golgin subfamily B member 1-like isoform X2 [Ceratina calcarata]|nr:golgin subfamily B member 1-like isoform X2 [Ceratina calcarata]XP_026667898.1 golgin subfamily B member 1-like isoform X2 [Ceratina calcarata]